MCYLDHSKYKCRVPTAFLNWGYVESYSLFLYPQCTAAYRRPHHFFFGGGGGGRTGQILGVKNPLQRVNGNAEMPSKVISL